MNSWSRPGRRHLKARLESLPRRCDGRSEAGPRLRWGRHAPWSILSARSTSSGEHLSLGFRGLRITPFLTQLSGTSRRAPRCNFYSVITMVMILLPSGCRPAVNFYIEVLVRVPGDESVRQ